jgi:hypothetical protein
MTTDLMMRLQGIHRLTMKVRRHELTVTAEEQARRAVANLALQLRTDEVTLIVVALCELQERLAQMLASWQLNKDGIKQGIHIALEAGVPAEADRLNERLAGISLLWDQLHKALQDTDPVTYLNERK